MNARRSAQADAVPPAAPGRTKPGTSRLIVPQVQIVARRENAAAPSALDTSMVAPDFARLDQEIGRLSAQNERLLKAVDTLLNLHESERTQRQSLQSTLDRVLEEVGKSTPAGLLETLGSEIRNGVSEDLKPLLNAIIELLELSARRGPARPAITPESNEIADAPDSGDSVANRDSASGQPAPEDLPGALPEILTKSVEELVGKRRADRAGAPKQKNPNTDGNERRPAFQNHRPHAWVPVTSGTLKP